MNSQTIELISFNICPFVQRSVIALNEKNIDHKITYIDLANPPDWFSTVSPLGKVPVLKVGDVSIFESAVIAEYLEEAFEPKLHPADALEKARHRSWIEFASDLTMNQYKLLIAEDEAAFNSLLEAVKEQLSQLEKNISADGPYFAGKTFSLIDTAYAPVFMRFELVNRFTDLGLYAKESRLQQWSDALLAKDSVQKSVIKSFEEEFLNYFGQHSGYLKFSL